MTQRESISPRERVLLSLAHQPADRPAFSWSFGPQPAALADLDTHLARWNLNYSQLFAATSDIRRFDVRYAGPALPPKTSHWGWTTKTVSYGTGSYDEFDGKPLANAQTVDDILRHPWPDPDHFDFDLLPGKIAQADPAHRYARILWIGNPLEILSWLMGLEKLMESMALEPELVHAALDRIVSFWETIMRRAFAVAPNAFDAVYGADDLGTQQGPMISRDTYRQLVMPYHQRMYNLAHEHVRFTIHHSDGSVYDLLDDLIEAGVDCLEAVQVECRNMEPEKIKARAGRRLAFQGAVSVQQVLPRYSAQDVRLEVRKLKNILGHGGGYICAPSHAIQAGTPPENVLAMVEEALETPLAEIARKITTTLA